MKTWIKEEKIPLSLAFIYFALTIIIKMVLISDHSVHYGVTYSKSFSIILILNTIIESSFLFVLSSYLTQRQQLLTFNVISIVYIILVPIITFCAQLLLSLLQSVDISVMHTAAHWKFSIIMAFWFKIFLLVANVYCLALPNILFFKWRHQNNSVPSEVKYFKQHQNILYSMMIFIFILAPLVISYALLFVGFNILVSLILSTIGIVLSITYLYYWHQPYLEQLNDQSMMLQNLQKFALNFVIGYTLISTILLALVSIFQEIFIYISTAPFAGIAETTGMIWTYILGIICFIAALFLSNQYRYKVLHTCVFIVSAIGVTGFLIIQGGALGFYVALHMVGPALFVLGGFLLILGLYTRFILKVSVPND